MRRNAKKQPVKRRKISDAPIQININPVEFADMCEDRDSQIRNAYLANAADPFMAEMAVYSLVELQQRIIGLEFFLSYNPPNEVSNLDRVEKYKKEHEQLYDRLKATMGKRFQPLYDECLKEENECARSNLDNNDGRLYSYVLPKFNRDGTHEPWGERDVPWNPGGKPVVKKEKTTSKRKRKAL